MATDPDLLERLWSRSIRSGECWLWQGQLDRGGYGVVRLANTDQWVKMHRVSAEMFRSDFDPKLRVDHSCGMNHCWNPDHLIVLDLWNRLWQWTKIDPTTGCWLWQGTINQGGYGMINAERRTFAVHRFAYIRFGPAFDHALTLDHLCRVRSCWNPDHLEPCTMRENCLRGESPSAVHARKTDCIRGHPLAGENLWIDGTGARQCWICERARRTRSNSRQSAKRKAARQAGKLNASIGGASSPQ